MTDWSANWKLSLANIRAKFPQTAKEKQIQLFFSKTNSLDSARPL